jgi:hypothetical protein
MNDPDTATAARLRNGGTGSTGALFQDGQELGAGSGPRTTVPGVPQQK